MTVVGVNAVLFGLIGTMVFLVCIAPLSYVQWPWLELIVAEGRLLTKEFDSSLVDIVRSRLR